MDVASMLDQPEAKVVLLSFRQKGAVMRYLIIPLLLLLSSNSTAQQAPWYQWQSKTTGGLICAQHSPGDGWIQQAGAFRTAGHCKQALPQNRKKP